MIRTAFPRPRDDDSEDVIWALSTAHALWMKDHRADALVWLQRASLAAAGLGEAFRSEELAHAARTLRILLEDEALDSLPNPPPPPSRAAPSPPPFSSPPPGIDDPLADQHSPTTIPAGKGDDFLDPWAERTPLRSFTPNPSVVTSALPLEKLRRQSKRPPPPPPALSAPEEDEAVDASTTPTWRPDPPPGPPPPPPPAVEEPPVSLENIAAFFDLPDEARRDLARLARIEQLGGQEEIPVAGLVLIVEGVGHIQPAILDLTTATVQVGEVLYARGSLARSLPLRIVAEEGPVTVAAWSDEVIDLALSSLPWVLDELRAQADRQQALAGSALGSLGERLDAALRQSVLERLEIRVLLEGEAIATQGQPVPGIVIVGAGVLDLEGPRGRDKLHPGDLLFPTEILGAGRAPATARAGSGGALVLFGDRSLAQELLVTWPPLLEIFAAG